MVKVNWPAMEREKIIKLPEIVDKRGNLSFAEEGQHIFFNISQVSYCYSTNEQIQKQGNEILIALSGSVSITIEGERKYILDQPGKGLYIPEQIQRTIKNISPDTICLIIASDSANEKINRGSLLKEYSVSDCPVIKLPEIGRNINLTNKNLPFDMKRIFYISAIPAGEKRGMHAHKFCHEILIAANGSFDVELDDGVNKKTVTLDNPACGLHIPPGIWAVEKEYSQDVVCLVLASDKYDADNYINTYSDFIKYRQDGN